MQIGCEFERCDQLFAKDDYICARGYAASMGQSVYELSCVLLVMDAKRANDCNLKVLYNIV